MSSLEPRLQLVVIRLDDVVTAGVLSSAFVQYIADALSMLFTHRPEEKLLIGVVSPEVIRVDNPHIPPIMASIIQFVSG